MKYAVEMISSATLYVPSFTKVGSTIQKLTRIDMKEQLKYKQIDIPTEHRNCISLVSFVCSMPGRVTRILTTFNVHTYLLTN
jgi:hypothetical protein